MAHVRPPKGSEGERTQVQKDDLLVTITGANGRNPHSLIGILELHTLTSMLPWLVRSYRS